jgi:methyl-accepting chemotaxis protein
LIVAGKTAEAAQWRADNTNKFGGAQVTALAKATQLQQDSAAEDNLASGQTARTMSLLVGGLVAAALVLGFGVAFFIARGLTGAVNQMMTAAQGLAGGDLEQQITVHSKDEIGRMADAFRAMLAYQRDIASAANAIADGDLSRSVEPHSQRDILGRAFEQMIGKLRDMVGQLQTSALGLADTSAELGSAATQTGSAVQHVTVAVQNVANGAQETSRSAQETTASVAQLTQVIDGIARGATDQARQVQTTSLTATRMAAANPHSRAIRVPPTTGGESLIVRSKL